jgi:hypothetical protein
MSLARPWKGAPWWTDVDQAELDVLVYALVRGIFRHRPRCAACTESTICKAVDSAIDEVLQWVHLRALLSRAEYLAAEKNGRKAA